MTFGKSCKRILVLHLSQTAHGDFLGVNNVKIIAIVPFYKSVPKLVSSQPQAGAIPSTPHKPATFSLKKRRVTCRPQKAVFALEYPPAIALSGAAVAVRGKTTGAQFMDFEVSPDDRIGGGSAKPRGRGGKPAKAKAKARPRKPARGERVEPGFGGGFFSSEEYYDDEPPKRGGRAPKGKKQPRARKQRKGFSLWRLIGRLFYWMATLAIVGCIAVGGVVYYYWMQMPAVSTWAVPERPANIRVVAADGQLIPIAARWAARRSPSATCRPLCTTPSSPSRTSASTSTSASISWAWARWRSKASRRTT